MRLHFIGIFACFPLLALAANGCTGDDPVGCVGADCQTAPGGPDGGAEGSAVMGFDFKADTSIGLVQGAGVDVTLTITRNGFDGPITTSVTGLPVGVTAGALVVPAGATTAKLTLSSLPNAVQGTSMIVISASDSAGAIKRTANATLVVRGTPGSPDTTFNATGQTRAAVGATGISVTSIAVQADGKAVVAGESDNDVVLARVGLNGMLDTTYGTQGKATGDFRIGGVSGQDWANGIGIAPDGSAVVAGYTVNPGSIYAIARFTPSGALDPTFNTTGYFTTQVTPQPLTPLVGDFIATSVAIQADAKPAFCAGALEMTTNLHPVIVTRMKTNGALDDTFGNGQTGFFYRHVFEGATNSDDSCNAIVTAPGDKLVMAGSSTMGGKRMFVGRLDKTGQLDTGFGSGGFSQIAFPQDADALSVNVLADGRVLVTGDSNGGIVIARLDASGMLDTSFGGTGKVTVDVGATIVAGSERSVIDATGRIVISVSTSATGDFAVARVLPTGVLDTTFGTGGHIAVKPVAAAVPQNLRIGQLADGRIVVANNLAAPMDLVAYRFWN